jgi:hypothetical protein
MTGDVEIGVEKWVASQNARSDLKCSTWNIIALRSRSPVYQLDSSTTE